MEKLLKEVLNEVKTLNGKIDILEKGQNSLGIKTDSLVVRTDSMAAFMKSGLDAVNKRLDKICAQVAHNTEQEIRLNDVVARVELLETDTKLLKQLVVK